MDVIDLLQKWLDAHDTPDEPIICVPDGETGDVSPRQFLEDVKAGEPYALVLLGSMKEVLKDLEAVGLLDPEED